MRNLKPRYEHAGTNEVADNIQMSYIITGENIVVVVHHLMYGMGQDAETFSKKYLASELRNLIYFDGMSYLEHYDFLEGYHIYGDDAERSEAEARRIAAEIYPEFF